MDIRNLSCCGIQELTDISDLPNPDSVIMRLVQQHYRPASRYYGARKPRLHRFSGFYIFSEVAVTYDEDNRARKSSKPTCQVGYGKALARYIRTHKLGHVSASRTARNRVNHPDHGLIVYTWAPSQRGLRAWAANHGFVF